MTIAIKAFQDVISHVSGLTPAWASTTTLTVSAGQARDSENKYDIALSEAVTVDSSLVSVAGGLDKGAIAASTWYYAYLLGSSLGNLKPIVTISTSPTKPSLFGGYDCYRYLFPWRTNGSSQFIKGYAAGTGNSRKHFYDEMQSVLSAGTAVALQDIVLTPAVPAVANTPVTLHVEHTPAAAGGRVSFSTAESSGTILPSVRSPVAGQMNSGHMEVISRLVSSVPTIKYINSAASGSTNAFVISFEYFI